jgi:co-chaperonin GroES (HSP10)
MSKELENAEVLAERSTKMVNTKNTIVLDDGSNEVTIPGFPYRFEAKGENVLVSVDIFKSGLECRTCKGMMRLKKECECESTDRPGFKYSKTQVADFANDLGDSAAEGRMNMICPLCEGHFEEIRMDIECPDCKGKGTLLHIPETSKSLPTTGVIVSLGNKVDPSYNYKRGQRVLFGQYTGVMIPTKAPGVVFKVLRQLEVLCEIKGGEDLANFDFVILDKPLN